MATEKESQHTPGPWMVAKLHEQGYYLNDGGISVLSTELDGGRICAVDIQTKVKRGTAHAAKDPIRDANARLIAAAPELLKACQRALCVLKATGESVRPNNVLGALDAAIAKATGK